MSDPPPKSDTEVLLPGRYNCPGRHASVSHPPFPPTPPTHACRRRPHALPSASACATVGKKARVPPGTKRKTKVNLPFGLTPVQLAGLVALVTVCVIGYSMVYDGSAPTKRVPKIPIKKLTKEVC